MAIVNEDRVLDAIRDGVERQVQDVTPGSPEHWRLIADVAVEAVVWDLARQAEAWGTDFAEP